jgi:hypothetical protein
MMVKNTSLQELKTFAFHLCMQKMQGIIHGFLQHLDLGNSNTKTEAEPAARRIRAATVPWSRPCFYLDLGNEIKDVLAPNSSHAHAFTWIFAMK